LYQSCDTVGSACSENKKREGSVMRATYHSSTLAQRRAARTFFLEMNHHILVCYHGHNARYVSTVPFFSVTCYLIPLYLVAKCMLIPSQNRRLYRPLQSRGELTMQARLTRHNLLWLRQWLSKCKIRIEDVKRYAQL
jgi:hypothetical protein